MFDFFKPAKETQVIIKAFSVEPPPYRLIFVYNICFISINTLVSIKLSALIIE